MRFIGILPLSDMHIFWALSNGKILSDPGSSIVYCNRLWFRGDQRVWRTMVTRDSYRGHILQGNSDSTKLSLGHMTVQAKMEVRRHPVSLASWMARSQIGTPLRICHSNQVMRYNSWMFRTKIDVVNKDAVSRFLFFWSFIVEIKWRTSTKYSMIWIRWPASVTMAMTVPPHINKLWIVRPDWAHMTVNGGLAQKSAI